jgi:hypothetical protein
MQTIIHNGHKIEITGWGKEKVYYDGIIVSSKWSLFGSTHLFKVVEDGIEVQYDVMMNIRWHGLSFWTEVRRDGKLIYTDR